MYDNSALSFILQQAIVRIVPNIIQTYQYNQNNTIFKLLLVASAHGSYGNYLLWGCI